MNWNKAMIFHTVIWLKLLFTAICTIFLQTSLVTRASVVITWNTQTNMKKKKKKVCFPQKIQENCEDTYTKHGSHIWVDHPRTFCHSPNSYCSPSNLRNLSTFKGLLFAGKLIPRAINLKL